MFSISTEHGMTLFPETFWSETEDLSTEEILSISNGAIKAHQKDEVWTSESGERLRDDAIQSWIDAFNGIQASNYLPSKTLSGKVRSLTIQFSNDTKKEAKLGKTEKGFTQVQLAPFTGVYQLDANLAKVLSNGADVFLEKKTEPVETSADLEEN
jgi:hypothetical protein